MVKKIRGKVSENQVNQNVVDIARSIWLAGLGAFAKAENESSRLFENLVKEGEEMENRSRKIANETLEDIRNQIKDIRGAASERWDKLEELFEERVTRVLNRLGVPTNEDVAELSHRVEALNQSIQELGKQRSNVS